MTCQEIDFLVVGIYISASSLAGQRRRRNLQWQPCAIEREHVNREIPI